MTHRSRKLQKGVRRANRWLKLAERRAWKYYRAGGAVIGLLHVWNLVAVPFAGLRRIRRRADVCPSGEFHPPVHREAA